MIQRLSVALAQNLPQALSYQAEHPQPIEPGCRVLVPLGRRESVAWVIGQDSGYQGRLRSVLALFDDPFRFSPAYLSSIAAISRTYLQSQGQLLEAALPQDLKAGKGYHSVSGPAATDSGLPRCRSTGFSRYEVPTEERTMAETGSYTGPLQLSGPKRFDELTAIAEGIMALGGSLLTVAGDAQTIETMAAALPGIQAYQSKTPIRQRRSIWQAAQLGEPQWIIGGVSAALLPIRGLAAILIVDADNPAHFNRFYRDYGPAHIVRLRAQTEALPLICCSKAPSMLTSWLCSQPDLQSASEVVEKKMVTVKPARWDRPEAVERFGQSLMDDWKPGLRCLYLVSAPKAVQSSWCPKCRRRHNGDDMSVCPVCSDPIRHFPRPSVPWLQEILKRRMQGTAAELVTVAPSAKIAGSGDGYQRIVLVGPETWISLDEIDGALRIWALIQDMRSRLSEDGEIVVFSSFHFHYALKLVNDSKVFFEREISYRRWFKLPPLYAVYQLDFRHGTLRELAALMRRWSEKFKNDDDVRIDQLRLISRSPSRGLYHGSLLFHGQAERIWASGLFPDRNTSARLIMA